MDYDWLVIGSGFGGSTSALRLTEKGYKVGVMEAGRRFEDDDYAESTWHASSCAIQGYIRGRRCRGRMRSVTPSASSRVAFSKRRPISWAMSKIPRKGDQAVSA